MVPEKAIIGSFKAPYNSKKASPISGAWKLQKGAFSGTRKKPKGFQIPNFQVPENSKKVPYLVTEKSQNVLV